ncbi:hypothetical protein LLH06_05170 [Mucilaginibacter daejeonensis]|uniref:hypothetical protein n=1 Tax=Mucilaginibacter daejeonensis TaxID=398049 RepID=UPI001D173DE6|nr:hypothetical protein [Mucilaginibacter daejeonensis]UEG54355.1 hypothetical protein LLH06_05170 [Mucilaginibacter daejeonensis]
MLRTSLCSAFLLTCTALSSTTYAQEHNSLRKPPSTVRIDGKLNDWGDSLYYYNADKKLNYTLANDAQNLYVAIHFNDRSEQERVLMAGLTLGINTRGKKKNEYTMTFPVADEKDNAEMMAQRIQAAQTNGDAPDREEMRKARMSRLKNIKVTGFKDIDYDILTSTNTLGFKAALDVDPDGNLVYEAVIPLRFFDGADITKNEWAFNFKINGITRPSGGNGQVGGMPGGRGGMGGGMGRGGMGGGMGGGRGGRGGGMGRGGNMPGGDQGFDRSALSKSEDLWERFYLNKG